MNLMEYEELHETKTSKLLYLSAIASSISVFQFGYHTGSFNTPKSIFIECLPNTVDNYLFGCIALTEGQFSFLTSLLPLFGILGTIIGGKIMENKGRKGSLLLNCYIYLLCYLFLIFSSNSILLMIGRIIAGIASGISLVINPVYLGEISPLRLKGTIGIINQLSIVLGIVVSQVFGIFFSSNLWRIIFVFPLLLNLVMFIGFNCCPESPAYLLKNQNGFLQAEYALQLLRNSKDVSNELTISEEEDKEVNGLIFTLKSHYYFPSLFMLFFAQLTQQLSGINGIMYYSTDILTSSFGDMASKITVLVNVFQFFGSLLSTKLVDTKGRKILLIGSSLIMGIFSSLLAVSLNYNYSLLSATCLFASIIAFSVGLGPIPFLLNAELSDSKSIGVNSTTSTMINLFFNFCIAMAFRPLSLFFSGAQNEYIGNVFFIFSAWLFIAAFIFLRLLPETKQIAPKQNITNLNKNWNAFLLN